MKKNVLDYEPEIALFVNDVNPVICYEAISWFSKNYLNKKGRLFLEIHENYKNQLLLLFKDNFSVKIIKDRSGKYRFCVTA